MFCKKCGKKSENSQKFCGYCGTKTEEISFILKQKCPFCKEVINTDANECSNCKRIITEQVSNKKTQHSTSDKKHDKQAEYYDSSQKYSTPKNSLNNSEVVVGVAMLLIGIALTWITYGAADGGGTYFVFWGLIIYGGYKIIKGLTS